MNSNEIEETMELDVCRDERCDRVGLHASHEICDNEKRRAKRQRRLGWADDPLEPSPKRVEPRIQEIIDECIVRAVESGAVKNFATIYNDVQNDYGSCHSRRLYRRLAALTKIGEVICVDFGGSLRGYVHPKSRLLRDRGSMRERLENLVYTSGDE